MNKNVWFLRPPTSSLKRLRLFCFPYAGAGATTYLPWSEHLKEIDVCALQLPGRGARYSEQPYISLKDLVDNLLPVILSYSDLPFAFFGHSMGAIVAFELAHRLRAEGCQEPRQLIVSASAAPSKRPPSSQWHFKDDKSLIEALRTYNGTPSEILDNEELTELLLPIIRADFAVLASFQYRPNLSPFTCPINVLSGDQDIRVQQEQLLAWKKETASHCEFKSFDGGHFFLNTHMETLLNYLGRILINSQSIRK